jgi:hypothetical protein
MYYGEQLVNTSFAMPLYDMKYGLHADYKTQTNLHVSHNDTGKLSGSKPTAAGITGQDIK